MCLTVFERCFFFSISLNDIIAYKITIILRKFEDVQDTREFHSTYATLSLQTASHPRWEASVMTCISTSCVHNSR